MPAPAFCRFAADAASGIDLLRARFYGHVYDRHFHDGYAIGLTSEGAQAFRARGARHVSTPGLVITMAPGEAHDGEAGDEAGFAYRMLYIPERAVGRTLHFPVVVREDPALARAIDRAARAIAADPDPLARGEAVDALIRSLKRSGGAAPRDTVGRERRAVARVRDLLHDRRGEPLTLDALAAEAGLSRFRLTRAFARAYGLPPHAYLMSLRLNEARRRLAVGEAPAQAAVAAGFVDQAHLTREFRRRMGVTPGAYRRMVCVAA